MKTIDKNYKKAWDILFAKLPKEKQEQVLAAPDGKASAELASEAEKLTPGSNRDASKWAGNLRNL